MANKIFNTRIKQKIDTSSNWENENPAIKKGELAIETDSSYTDDQSVFNTGVNLHVGKTDNSHLHTNDETAIFMDKEQTIAEVKKAIADRFYECSSAEYDNLPASKLVDGKIYYIPDGHESERPRVIYGFHIDPNESDPYEAVTYIAEAIGMVPAKMNGDTFSYGSWANAFFMPKPCMVKYDGTVDYYLDPNDYSKKLDGTESDVSDANYGGNAMMEWPLIWYKFDTFGCEEGEVNFYVSNEMVDSNYRCWCNYDADGNIIPHFYTAIYNGTGTDKLRSISGVQLTSANGSGNTTGRQEITRAMANNTSDLTEWYTDLWADRVLATALLLLMGKSLNLQAIFGRGLDSGGQTAKESYITGALNDKGLFWGVTGNGTNAVKVFGMENFWGCAWHRTAGLFGTSTGYAYKLTHGNIDGSTATKFGTTANGYISVIATQPEIGYVTKMIFGKYGMLPFATGGSTSSYYCDNYTGGPLYLIVGGASYYGLGCGFAITLNTGTSANEWYLSTSLSLKPRAKNVI